MQKNGVSEESPGSRSKIPLRQRYLLEKERIRQEHGDLEQIRLTLGLSQRKVCQLLLVDPSAWTRWNKSGAPPHIYQALRWLIELRKSNPEAAPLPDQLDRRVDALQTVTQGKLKELESNLAALERTVGFAAAFSAPQSMPLAADATLEIERALRTQEMKFQLEIANLKARFEELLAQKPPRPAAARKAKRKSKRARPKPRPPAKAQKKRSPPKPSRPALRRAKAVAKRKPTAKARRRATAGKTRKTNRKARR